MLNCHEVAERAEAYLDSELGVWTGLRVLFHLKLCISCQKFIKQMEHTRALIEYVDYENETSAPDDRLAGILRELNARKSE